MKAIVCTQYGPPDVLQIKEIPQPVPGDNAVLNYGVSGSVPVFSGTYPSLKGINT